MAKPVVDVLPTFKELQALMDEHCSENHFDGPLPSDEETAFLAEEDDEAVVKVELHL